MDRRLRTALFVLVLLQLLFGCGSTWEARITGPDGPPFMVDPQVLRELSDFADDVDGRQGVRVERLLVGAGYSVVERLRLVGPEGVSREFDWATVADRAWWLMDGRLVVGDETLPAHDLEVTVSPLVAQVGVQMSDLAPTTAQALGLPPPKGSTGQPLNVSSADSVVLVFLDGFGYLRYGEALRDGLIPHLAALGEPLLGMTVYPPCTSVGTASLLTGAPPSVNGVDQRGIRQTEEQTIFDVAADAGLRVVAVEGESLAFNLRGSEMQLSGDRDGNGGTDDNVLANTLAVLEQGVPDILFVHFHGIDDAGHTYGPGAPEEMAKIREVDEAVGQVLDALPEGVLVIVFADHGMHAVQEEGRLGNHAHLIERDMLIPVWVVR
jgi:hypothetical protein